MTLLAPLIENRMSVIWQDVPSNDRVRIVPVLSKFNVQLVAIDGLYQLPVRAELPPEDFSSSPSAAAGTQKKGSGQNQSRQHERQSVCHGKISWVDGRGHVAP